MIEPFPDNEIEKQTSMLWWFPRIQNISLPVKIPRTILINANYWELIYLLDGKIPIGARGTVRKIRKAGSRLGWPIFLRTDLTSGKHSWKYTCYCRNHKVIPGHIAALVEDTALKDIDFHALAVREFLSLRYGFHAFDDMPVAREFRFFVRDEKVVHIQPYWPPDAIRRPDNENWKDILKDLSLLDSETETLLSSAAENVGQAFKNYWSVDFAQHVDGNWYLIDMARGEISYHYQPGDHK